jgi:hypothetical protein
LDEPQTPPLSQGLLPPKAPSSPQRQQPLHAVDQTRRFVDQALTLAQGPLAVSSASRLGTATMPAVLLLAAQPAEGRLRIFGQRDKLKAHRSKRGVRGGHKEEATQRRIHGARAWHRQAVPQRLPVLRTAEGEPLPPNILAELLWALERLRQIREQITEIEAAQRQRLKEAPSRAAPDDPAAGQGPRCRRSKVVSVGHIGYTALVPKLLGGGADELRRVDRQGVPAHFPKDKILSAYQRQSPGAAAPAHGGSGSVLLWRGFDGGGPPSDPRPRPAAGDHAAARWART